MRRRVSCLRGDPGPSGEASVTNKQDRAPSLADAIHAAVVAGETLIRAGLGVLAGDIRPTPIAVRTATASECDGADEEPVGCVAADMSALMYELLDAHADTAALADELWYDPRWAAHLDHLRALQPAGREALAHPYIEIGE